MKDSYIENYKTLMKELIKELSKWRNVVHIYSQEDSIFSRCYIFPT